MSGTWISVSPWLLQRILLAPKQILVHCIHTHTWERRGEREGREREKGKEREILIYLVYNLYSIICTVPYPLLSIDLWNKGFVAPDVIKGSQAGQQQEPTVPSSKDSASARAQLLSQIATSGYLLKTRLWPPSGPQFLCVDSEETLPRFHLTDICFFLISAEFPALASLHP